MTLLSVTRRHREKWDPHSHSPFRGLRQNLTSSYSSLDNTDLTGCHLEPRALNHDRKSPGAPLVNRKAFGVRHLDRNHGSGAAVGSRPSSLVAQSFSFLSVTWVQCYRPYTCCEDEVRQHVQNGIHVSARDYYCTLVNSIYTFSLHFPLHTPTS